MKSSKSEEALKILEKYKDPDRNSLAFFDYLKGNILLQKGLYVSSIASFQKFLSGFRGHNYIKDTYFKIGLNYWLSGNLSEADKFFDLARKNGHRITESDKNASHMLDEIMPDRNIMKLRLSTDGGYYDRARALVEQIQKSGLTNHKDSVEFIYRQARVLHKSRNKERAIDYYKKTIEISENESWYFAPNSALQLGFIFREKGMLNAAKKYFEMALSYKNHPYKNSIDNKAEAALSALQNN